MRKFLNVRTIILLFGLLILTFWLVRTPLADATGKKAPDWSLKGMDGKAINFSDFSGKVVIVNLWATWCPPCRREIPDFIELQKEYKEQGLVIIGISLDQSEAPVKPFVEKNSINYPVVMGNSEVAQLYGNIRSIPTTFIVDSDGNIVESFFGLRSKEIFEESIKPLLKKVKSPAKAKPVE